MARTRYAQAFEVVLAIALGLAAAERPASAASPRQDVQQIGLAPLYEALFAVANCADVALDEPAFRRVAGLYHLTTTDLTPNGSFAPEIAALAIDYRVRFEADRAAFCDESRLQFAVPQGILVDLNSGVRRPRDSSDH